MDVLYITYDGLTDFIGQSQVLPYLLGCARAGHRLTVISFEKEARQRLMGERVERACREAGIRWLPQRFRTSPPYLAKYLDLRAMRRAAAKAVATTRFDLLHCRSYQAALVGEQMGRRFDLPYIFDMRGFLPDSRREGGRWSDRSPIGRALYARWKNHEARLVSAAAHIVVLTHAAREEIQGWSSYGGTPISVIPCSADFEHFRIADAASRLQARERLGLPADAPILAYLGSLGTIYLGAEHMRLFAAIKRRDPRARALFIGRDSAAAILAEAADHGIDLAADDIRVVQAERNEVPFWLGAADVATCFYTPTYSSLGVSPTKLAEYLACGIPVIANRAVGDVEAVVNRLEAGHVLPDFSDKSIGAAAEAFMALLSIDREAVRRRARPGLDLADAVAAYSAIYDHPGKAVSIGR